MSSYQFFSHLGRISLYLWLETSEATINSITDRVFENVRLWQQRSLESVIQSFG